MVLYQKKIKEQYFILRFHVRNKLKNIIKFRRKKAYLSFFLEKL